MNAHSFQSRTSKRTQLITCALLFVILCARPGVAYQPRDLPSEQDDSWTALKTDDGALFIWNRPGINFTLSLRGTNVQPLNYPEHIFFTVDGVVFQIQSLPITNFAPEAKKKGLDQKTILAAHRDWEVQYLEGALGGKVKVQSTYEKLAIESEGLFWQYDMPAGVNNETKKQLYLSVVSNDHIILLNGVVSVTTPEETVRAFLLGTMATLKLSPERIDVKKLQKEIKKGNGP